MRTSQILAIILALISLSLPACNRHEDQPDSGHQKIVVTSPKAMDVKLTENYVCQIHSRRHINVRALTSGYLEEILVKEGQLVKKDALMFRILPTLYKAKLDAAVAERDLAELELQNTERLAKQKIVSPREVALYKAKLARAEANRKLAEAEYKFTEVRAPFEGIIDRLHDQLGSLIKERDILTTLSDNSLMWVYFPVPEKQYIAYNKTPDTVKERQQIELVLADHSTFNEIGKIGAIEAKFNNEIGTVFFRADFLNPKRLLRHGMTGTILIHRPLKNALVIPQRATFEILAKRYVFVVDKKEVVHQREIVVQHELDDIYVIDSGLSVNDKFIYEGIRQVRDGEKVQYEFRPPQQILEHLKFHAE